MAARLKIYRTAIGFHDAYVAAPSQKAALEAWGADANLFARGMAEIVTDPDLAAEPLAQPGKVIKRRRGSTAEHIAALPETPNKAKAKRPAKAKATAEPRPSRSALDAAERALDEAERGFAVDRRALAQREAALARERAALEKRITTEKARLDRAREEEEGRYRRALDRWRG